MPWQPDKKLPRFGSIMIPLIYKETQMEYRRWIVVKRRSSPGYASTTGPILGWYDTREAAKAEALRRAENNPGVAYYVAAVTGRALVPFEKPDNWIELSKDPNSCGQPDD